MSQFKKFFTKEALGLDRTQREYLETDLLVINTIRALRARGDDWDDIEAALASGMRERELPPSALLVETTAPIAQYGRIVELQTALDAAEEQIDELQEEITRLRNELEQKNTALQTVSNEKDKIHRADIERLMLESSEREGKLQREMGKLEALIEMLRSKND